MPSAWRGSAAPKFREYVPEMEQPQPPDLQAWKDAVKERDAPIVRRGVRNKRGGY